MTDIASNMMHTPTLRCIVAELWTPAFLSDV
jgi:hypothetical protein